MITRSIIIPSKNDPGIADTISALLKHKDARTEIIVVDRSFSRLDHIRRQFGRRIVWIDFVPPDKSKFTIPEQRNLGIKKARGQIIVFIDANCLPERNWLNRLTRPIATGSELVTCGPAFSRRGRDDNGLYYQQLGKVKFVDECPTINMAFSKQVVKTIGWFDEKFDYGSDIDFSWRLGYAGIKIRYLHDAVVTHDWGTKSDEFKRMLVYGQARARLFTKHFHRKWPRLLNRDIMCLVYPALILMLPILLIAPWLYILLFLALVLKNIGTPDPLMLVIKHYFYGLGILKEVLITRVRFSN